EVIAKECKLQAVVINSGNANACTGKKGEQDDYTMRQKVADTFSILEHHVAVASTSVIGVEMPMDKIATSINILQQNNRLTDVQDFNQSIQTTDTMNK